MAAKKVNKKYQDGGVKKDSTSTRTQELKRMLDDIKPYEIKKYPPPIKKKGGTTKSKK